MAHKRGQPVDRKKLAKNLVDEEVWVAIRHNVNESYDWPHLSTVRSGENQVRIVTREQQEKVSAAAWLEANPVVRYARCQLVEKPPEKK